MSTGQAQPPRLLEPFAKNAPTCTQASPVVGGKTFPLPQPSQILVLGGAASLDDGFPPLTMTDPAQQGIPPFGIDMNGILFYLSSWCAYLAAGQRPFYDATLQAAMTGYAQGAKLAQAAAPWETWTSIVDGNLTNPDTGGAGWVSSVPIYSAAALSGTNNVVLPGASDYVLDVNTAAGPVTYSGFVAQRDGQRISLTATGANILNLTSLAGSTAGNQLCIPSDLAAVQNQTYTFQYSTGKAKWILV